MPALREKSEHLVAFLSFLLGSIPGKHFRIITPENPEQRGCQISIQTQENGKAIFDKITRDGVMCDWREPDVIRIAAVPLYNSYTDVWRFAQIFQNALHQEAA